jgi:hypothetical protein
MARKYTVIAPVGDHLGALFTALRDFPAERVFLLTPERHRKDAERARQGLARLPVPASVVPIGPAVWEEMFAKVADIKAAERGRELLVVPASGDRTSTCAITCAAFVNGLKAVSVEGEETMLLPVLKFSYYKLLSDKKLGLLRILHAQGPLRLEALARKARMSLPLLSYHVHGNLKSEGLEELGLVEFEGRTALRLSMLGRLLIKGYIGAC